jgi:hypothetical protein
MRIIALLALCYAIPFDMSGCVTVHSNGTYTVDSCVRH